jgi:hypothetical protein
MRIVLTSLVQAVSTILAFGLAYNAFRVRGRFSEALVSRIANAAVVPDNDCNAGPCLGGQCLLANQTCPLGALADSFCAASSVSIRTDRVFFQVVAKLHSLAHLQIALRNKYVLSLVFRVLEFAVHQ